MEKILYVAQNLPKHFIIEKVWQQILRLTFALAGRGNVTQLDVFMIGFT